MTTRPTYPRGARVTLGNAHGVVIWTDHPGKPYERAYVDWDNLTSCGVLVCWLSWEDRYDALAR